MNNPNTLLTKDLVVMLHDLSIALKNQVRNEFTMSLEALSQSLFNTYYNPAPTASLMTGVLSLTNQIESLLEQANPEVENEKFFLEFSRCFQRFKTR